MGTVNADFVVAGKAGGVPYRTPSPYRNYEWMIIKKIGECVEKNAKAPLTFGDDLPDQPVLYLSSDGHTKFAVKFLW